MKKLIVTTIALFLSLNAFAQQAEVQLNAKEITYGKLSQETNSPVNELIVIRRTSETPTKVTMLYSFNYMVKKCIAYKVKKENIKDFTQTVCKENADGSHDCTEKTYTGLFDAETICTKKGLIRKTEESKLVLNFKSAVKLTEGAEETFQVNLTQKKISHDKVTLKGQALNTSSLYKVKTRFHSIKFKAE